MDPDYNKITLYSFIGGTFFTTNTKVKKRYATVPKGFKKTVSFYVLFYGNGTPLDLVVKINSQVALLDNNIYIKYLNKVSCSGSDTLTQSVY